MDVRAPVRFFLPWDTPQLPVEVRREVFMRLSEQIGAKLADQGLPVWSQDTDLGVAGVGVFTTGGLLDALRYSGHIT